MKHNRFGYEKTKFLFFFSKVLNKLPQETTPITVHGLLRSIRNIRGPPESPFVPLS